MSSWGCGMDDEDIRHWQHLIIEYKRHLRILEEKVVGYGKLECPPHILKDAEDTQRQIKDFEQRIRRRIRRADDSDILYSIEEVDEIYDKFLEIIWIEESIRLEKTVNAILERNYYGEDF